MNRLALLGKGVLIGFAEIIPSVSGGTIALLTGIWAKIIANLARFGPDTMRMLGRREFARFWHEHNMEFLLLVLSGSLIGLFGLAQLVHLALEHQPDTLMALIFGIVLGSVPRLVRSLVSQGAIPLLPWLLTGALAGLLVGLIPPGALPASPVVMFASAMIASCAALLPGLSGAYILLLIGVYDEAVRAVAEIDFTMLTTLALGIGCGVFLFARVIRWLLSKQSTPIMALLVGLVIGSLWKVMPTGINLSEAWGLAASGAALPIGTCVLLMVLGAVCGFALSRRVDYGDANPA